jgi:chemotaxis protein MotB
VNEPDARHAEPPRIRKAWLITFADLLSLVLTFFVMMFAMQTIDQTRFTGLAESLSRSLDAARPDPDARRRVERNAPVLSPRHAADLGYLEALLRDKGREDPLLRAAPTRLAEDRLVVTLPADAMFAEGSAELNERARASLYALAGLFGHIGNGLSVEGHSDPTPPTGAKARSNRALSLARAAAVADALRGYGYPRAIPASGFGASRFGELVNVEPRSRRYELARRVDLVVSPYRGAP